MIRTVKIKHLIKLRDKLNGIISKNNPEDTIIVNIDYMLTTSIGIPDVNLDNMSVKELWRFFYHKDPPSGAHFSDDLKYIVWDYGGVDASISINKLKERFYNHPEDFNENGIIIR